MGVAITSFHSSSIISFVMTTMFLLLALVMLIFPSTDQVSNMQHPPSHFVGLVDVHLLLIISWLLHLSQASLCVVQVMPCVVILLINYQLFSTSMMFVSSFCLLVIVQFISSSCLPILVQFISSFSNLLTLVQFISSFFLPFDKFISSFFLPNQFVSF